MTERACILGVFIGGKGTRMGGVSKAALRAPDGAESLAQRWVRIGEQAGLQVVFVGQGDVGAAIDHVPRLVDDPPGLGPLGALTALLKHAQQRDAHAVAVACDMPYVSAELLTKLAHDPRDAAVLCPRTSDGDKWEALFARYEPSRGLEALRQALAAAERSLQRVIARVRAEELRLSVTERAQLRDWDTPGDVER
jgi:molybdopterin-guanine dinucleotide biosynthesis protein A